jgi:hypothetical protein
LSRLRSSSPFLALLGVVLGLVALIVAVDARSRSDDLADRFTFVSNFSAEDAVAEKEVNAPCPAGTKLIGGGGGVQHGGQTAGVAIYLSFPVGQKWNVRAGKRAWTLFAIAACFKED